jgi:hypothetical protein
MQKLGVRGPRRQLLGEEPPRAGARVAECPADDRGAQFDRAENVERSARSDQLQIEVGELVCDRVERADERGGVARHARAPGRE